MNIPENTAPNKRPRSAKRYAASHRRRIERAEATDWRRTTYTDPATGRTQVINIRHS
nr:MAG TPA: hypothetical protein [Caudoviricetes sp.]